ncbi:hypothetical protein [Streptomyces sp. SA3_actF]|uniref:hypothetical protein n=1 Tax=Streptomyces sp. SA3_actF TaxID=682181 RepID=UPI0001FFFE8B|nr:hypothetical protein [Streptomyces sp. SA3_actF]
MHDTREGLLPSRGGAARRWAPSDEHRLIGTAAVLRGVPLSAGAIGALVARRETADAMDAHPAGLPSPRHRPRHRGGA